MAMGFLFYVEYLLYGEIQNSILSFIVQGGGKYSKSTTYIGREREQKV